MIDSGQHGLEEQELTFEAKQRRRAYENKIWGILHL